MNYGFWLMVGQSQQTGLLAAQSRQLGAINSHLAQQHFAHQQQAMLGQLLFDTEEFARHVDGVEQRDRFAAAFLSMMRMRAVASVRPETFFAVEHKRAWSGVTAHLDAKWRSLDPASREVANLLAGAIDELRRLQAILGPQPKVKHEALKYELASVKRLRIVLLVIGLVSIPLTFLIYFPVVPAFVCTFLAIGKGSEHQRKRADLEAYEAALQQWQGFQVDPRGAQLFDRLLAEHPLLRG